MAFANIQTNGTVGNREFAMQAEMNEAGIKHPAILRRPTRSPKTILQRHGTRPDESSQAKPAIRKNL